MNTAVCALSQQDAGVIRELLTTTRCNVGVFSEAGYHALTGPHSIFPLAVTALLTIYVAVLGYRLLLGHGAPQLSEIPVIGIKIGTVLALTLNWTVFQTLVLDIAARAPTEIASAIVGPQYSPVDRLQTAYDQIRTDEAAFAKLAQADAQGPNSNNAIEASNELSYASNALLAATGGLLAFATVVTGVLALVGPIFLTLFLFESAGGLFTGWVRAIAAAAFVPMLCWITTIILLAAIEPRLALLDDQRAASTLGASASALDASTAIVTCFIIYVFAAAQFGLVIASTIVAAGFRFPARRKKEPSTAMPLSPAMQVQTDNSRIDQLVLALRRNASTYNVDAPAVSVQGAMSSTASPAYEVSGRAQRLGEGYRRMPDRLGRRPDRAGRL
ncbi:MAG TPA: type IV secretion system protein [Rhizomicrobium sp.]|nr:type IV secretion system protein [Rhizomicrobium sp.]